MKKIFMLMLILLASLISVNAELDVDLDDYVPRPVEPDEKFIAVFDIRNLETTTETYEVRLTVKDPFFLTTSSLKEITLDPGETDDVKFRVDVDDDATETVGIITFNYRILNSSDPWTREDFEIDIDNEVSLEITSVFSSPEVIGKGNRADLSIVLENNGDVDLRDIRLELDLANIPIAPYNSVSFKEIDRIDSGEKETIILSIVALDNADSGFFKIPITLEFEDEDGNDFRQVDIISVRVGSQPKIDVITETNFIIIGERNFIDLSVINKGEGDAEFLEAQLFVDPKYNILGTSKIYLGSVDSDDFEDLSFDIFVNGEDVVLSLNVIYEDDSGREFSEVHTVQIKTYTRSEAQKLGLVERDLRFIWGIAILAVIVIFFVVRKIRKRRKHEE